MTDVISVEAYEEADLASSYHWASQSEIYSVLHVTPVHGLAVPVAPLSTGSGVLAFPTGSLGELEEQLGHGTVRLSDTVEWTVPSDVFCEVVFMELPVEQWSSVTSVLTPPANVGVFHADGRMPFGPDLLSQVIEDGRFGNLDALGYLSQDAEATHTATSEVPARSFPMPKARAKELPTVARRGRGTGNRGRAKQRPSSPSGQEDLHSLLTTLTERIEAMESSSGPRQASNNQPAGTSAPNLLGVPSKFTPSAAYERARELIGGPKLPLIAAPPPVKAKTAMVPQASEPLSSGPPNLTATLDRFASALEKGCGKASFEAGYGTDVCAAQSEEEYAGMISDSCGSGIKLGGRALLEKVRKTREEYPAIILASHEAVVKKDLGVLPGESWSWTRHAYEEVLGHCGNFKSLKRCICMIAAALDEGRAGSLERQQAMLCQIYTVCESAAKDPSHDLTWGWPVLGIRDPEGRAQPGWAPAESAAVIAFHRENAALESAKKLLGPTKRFDKANEDEGTSASRAAASKAMGGKVKGKGKDVENPV